ncbi:MAG TPA: glutamyl-tRNA reductase [Actinomycetota bacterium]|nr:glutamyl-tRNA reductase [Actinomycetota bacterium]
MIVALSAGRSAPAELRDRLALTEDGQRKLLRGPRPGIAELIVLSTCHRTEIYATGDGLDSDVVHAVAAIMPGLLPTDHHDVRFMQGAEAIEHLFRVACGLDSLVIGEPQVLGQVRRALTLAEEAGSTGPVLTNIFGRAIRLGRQVRNETPLGRLARSVGDFAADYLNTRFIRLDDRKVLIVGAGEIARDAAFGCRKGGATLTVASRTLESAQELADDIGAEAYTLASLPQLLPQADVAIVALSGNFKISTADLPAAPASPLLILDLSVPRVVDAVNHESIEVLDLDEIPGPRGPEITDAMIDAESMVKREVADLLHWADTRASGPTIKELHSFAEQVVNDEVRRAMGSLGLTEEQEVKLRSVGQRIANKLLHGPTVELRRCSDADRATIRRIFHLPGD